MATKTDTVKSRLIQAMRENLGIVTIACEKVGIARSTYYKYLDKDEVFKAAIKAITEEVYDFAENALYEKIKKGDTTAIIFFLKTRAKDRGYVERTEQHTKVDFTQDPFEKIRKINDIDV